MIILDEPYVSQEFISWLVSSQQPVLDNAMARKVQQGAAAHGELNLVPDEQAAQRIDAGERVLSVSEESLSWVRSHVHNQELLDTIDVFKNKGLMRELLAPLDPTFYYKVLSAQELQAASFESFTTPFVIKPTVGFLSIGVHVVKDRQDWEAALAAIEAERKQKNPAFDTSVVDESSFIVESFIQGTEFAIDAFYDHSGQAHILNIFRHDFADDQDTSDRIYVTSPAIISEWHDKLRTFLTEVNTHLSAVDFPMHVEVRVGDDGVVRPIEFNPLRFAGMGTSDLSLFAYGFLAADLYLGNNRPAWSAIEDRTSGQTFCFSVLNAPEDMDGTEEFDYMAFAKRFSHMLVLRPFDYRQLGAFGVLFCRVDESTKGELDWLKTSDLREFLRPAGTFAAATGTPIAPPVPSEIPANPYIIKNNNGNQSFYGSNSAPDGMNQLLFSGGMGQDGSPVKMATSVKVFWVLSGVFLGIFGFIMALILTWGANKLFRNQSLLYASIGMVVGWVISILLLTFVIGDSTGLLSLVGSGDASTGNVPQGSSIF